MIKFPVGAIVILVALPLIVAGAIAGFTYACLWGGFNYGSVEIPIRLRTLYPR